MFPVNCYILWNEDREAIVIDQGCYFEEEKQIFKQYITKHRLTVKLLLNTHLHLDHIFGNSFMLKEYGVKSNAHKEDEFWLENAPQQSRMFGFNYDEKTAPLEKYLYEGDIVGIKDIELKAIHVPGHSPGSLVYYCEKEGCMFSGDVLFQGSIGRADLKGGNFDELKENICSKLFTLPEETIVYPGHGPSTSIGEEKKNNPFFR